MAERIAGFDTNTLIHAFRDILPEVRYNDNEREMSRRAKLLIQTLTIQGTRVVVPSIVVAEYLKGIDPGYYEGILSVFLNQFEMPPFDLKAVAIAARLWRSHRDIPKDEQLDRKVLKVDTLIIATAKAFGVTDYYTNDRGSRQLAEQAGLAAHDLPERSPFLLPEVITPPHAKKSKKSPPDS